MACWRGLQIFALAFLFRLQAQLLGWGPLVNLLKVDILNVMGIAMLAAAILWSLSSHRAIRIALFATATAALAMSHAAGERGRTRSRSCRMRSRPTSVRWPGAPTSRCFPGPAFCLAAPSPAS